MALKFEQITEGKTKLLVPEDCLKFKGPGKKIPAFYNPLMGFSRDISVMVLAALKCKNILDGLAGAGARGIRIANEVGGEVVVNDKNRTAYETIKKNIYLNELKNAKAENKDLNILLSEEGSYDYIDIDPFGTPAYFTDVAFRIARKNTVLGLAATDLAALCGAAPKACLRRYSSKPLKTEYGKELGLRILIGFCVKQAAKYHKAAVPILSYYADHYFRIYLRIDEGAKKANRALENIGYIAHDFNTGKRKVLRHIGMEKSFSGPLWLGNLSQQEILKRLSVSDWLGTNQRITKFLPILKEEVDAMPFYYEINGVAKILRIQPKKLVWIIESLKESGFTAARTHFSPSGFKTNASMKEIAEVLS